LHFRQMAMTRCMLKPELLATEYDGMHQVR
jgi:hypothetical protein